METIERHMDLKSEAWKTDFPAYTLYQSKEMTKDPVLSVIIPNWNNAPYLKRAMQSLVDQTLGLVNMEILVCDDFSSDHSISILRNFVDKHPNFSVYAFHKNTGAAATPRNLGITKARGKYVAFFDSDDWYHKDGLKELVDLLEKSGDSFAIGQILRMSENLQQNGFAGTGFLDGQNIPVETLPTRFYSWLGPQSILLKRDLIEENNLHFPIMRTSDDQKFFLEALLLSKTISKSSKVINYFNQFNENIGLMKLSSQTTAIFDNAWVLWEYLMESGYHPEILHRFISKKVEIQFERFFANDEMSAVVDDAAHKKVLEKLQSIEARFGFNPSDYFDTKTNQIAWQMMAADEFEKAKTFLEWTGLDETERKTLREGNVLYYVPLIQGLANIPKTLDCRVVETDEDEESIFLTLEILTTLKMVNSIFFREDSNPVVMIEFPLVSSEGSHFTFKVEKAKIDEIRKATYSIFLRVEETYFSRIQVAEELVERILDFGFFKTGANNIALKNRPTVKAVSLAKVGHDFEMELLATGYGVEKLENLRMVHRRVSQDFINIPLMPIEKGCFHVVIPSDTLSQLSNGKYKVIVGWEFLEEIYFKVTSIDFIALKKSGFSKTPSNYLEFTQQEYACKVVEAKLVDERVSLKIQVLPFQAKSYFLRLANLVDTNETIDFASVAVEGEIVSFLISISELPEDMRAIIQIHWGESQREMVKTEVDTLQGIQSSGFLRSINGNLSFLMESEH